MTAPVYTDILVVEKMHKDVLLGLASRNLIGSNKLGHPDDCADSITRVARVAMTCWRERDKARETAAMQDEAIHQALPKTHELEMIWRAVRRFQELGYESGFKDMNDAILRMVRFEAVKRKDETND